MKTSLPTLDRRRFALGLASLGALGACSNGIGSPGGAEIDARVDSTLNFMYSEFPDTVNLAQKASGILVMPVVTEVGFGFGGGFGRGALRLGNATVDYYSAASGSAGIQIGAQQFAQVYFFMTDEALTEFRRSSGWTAGAGVDFVFQDEGGDLSTSTTTTLAPVVAVVFGQAGLRVGATVEGTKFTRIIP